jgi:hypothetical protein
LIVNAKYSIITSEKGRENKTMSIKKQILLLMLFGACLLLLSSNCVSSRNRNGEGGIFNLSEKKLGKFKNLKEFVQLLIDRYYLGDKELANQISRDDMPIDQIVTFVLVDTRKRDNFDDLKKNLIDMVEKRSFFINLYEEREDEHHAFNRKIRRINESNAFKRVTGKYWSTRYDERSNVLLIKVYLPTRELVSIEVFDGYLGNGEMDLLDIYENAELIDQYGLREPEVRSRLENVIKDYANAKILLTREEMNKMSKLIYRYLEEKKMLPKNMRDLRRIGAIDAWGRGIQYSKISESAFELRSLGNDGILNTADDIVISY